MAILRHLSPSFKPTGVNAPQHVHLADGVLGARDAAAAGGLVLVVLVELLLGFGFGVLIQVLDPTLVSVVRIRCAARAVL
jgi:hypothetical protein